MMSLRVLMAIPSVVPFSMSRRPVSSVLVPRWTRFLLVIALGAASVATACGTEAEPTAGVANDQSTTENPDDGAWPHDFTAPLVDGGTIDAGDYAGQDLVLWFWAPW